NKTDKIVIFVFIVNDLLFVLIYLSYKHARMIKFVLTFKCCIIGISLSKPITYSGIIPNIFFTPYSDFSNFLIFSSTIGIDNLLKNLKFVSLFQTFFFTNFCSYRVTTI